MHSGVGGLRCKAFFRHFVLVCLLGLVLPTAGYPVVYSCQASESEISFTWRPNPIAAVRFGEANNPGPPADSCTSIRFCISNPTCVAKKSDSYKDLFRQHKIHIATLSETAATEVAQKKFASEMKSIKCRMLWSPPVPPLSETSLGHANHRGKAAGVGLASLVPVRPARIALADEWNVSTRLLHGIVNLGQSHAQVIVLYCRPVSSAGAVEFNNTLLVTALQQVDKIPLPFLILGDLNMDVSSFQAWQHLEARGCRSLDQIHQRLYSTIMPNTCKEVTRPDNGIVSPALVPFVSEVKVLEPTWFATHSPVMFQIDLPGQALFAYHLRFPKSFVELGIDDETWQSMTDQHNDFANAQTIQQWGLTVEKHVDLALRAGKGAVKKLGRAYRGRCQPARFVKCPILAPTKVANHGSFEPSTEVLTMPSRRKVTQLRRLESFQRRLARVEKHGPKNDSTFTELACEWKAILRSHAFGLPFLHWICGWPEIDWPLWPLPTADWVFQAVQVTRFQVEASLKQDELIQQRKAAYVRQLDRSCNNKQAFAVVRGPGLPRVFEVGRQVSFDAMIVHEGSPTDHRVYADNQDILQLSMEYPIALGTHQAKIVELEEHSFLACTVQPVPEWEEEIHVAQQQFVVSPGDIAKQLDAFWKPIWSRDPDSAEFLQMTPEQLGFQHVLDQIPPHPAVNVDMLDPVAWKLALKKLKPQSAKGTDLISAQELKLLPLQFILELARILAGYSQGFPESFMHGLVCPLSKTDEIPRADQTRPITLLPQIYRLWAAVASYQITRVICAWVPTEVTGLLPGRGAASSAYFSQFVIEQARKTQNQLSGLTLDLVKCFNCISWSFGFHAMAAMGIPTELLNMWIGSLQVLTRHWMLSNQVIHVGKGTCGFPEGDQYSVLVMISLATAWISQARSVLPTMPKSFLSAYADNWSWMLSMVDLHLPVLKKAGIRIDWGKTWFWSTCERHAGLIQSFVQECAPGQTIHQKSSAADLGFQLQYSGNNELGIATTRVEKGLKRLERLQAMPHQLSVKEAMIRASILPAALHGAEIKPPSGEILQQLRSKCAHALYGSSSSLSPAIALACSNGALLDPEFWLVSRALATARAFLLRQDDVVRRDFLAMCCKFRGNLQHVHGPASALAFMLCNLDWKLDATGVLHVTAFLSFPLLEISMHRVKRFLQEAWMDKLIMLHSQRTKWFHFPDIDRDASLSVLRKFQDSKRWLLVREIAGAYQTANQKQKWLDNAAGTCEFCQKEDSRRHRLLECPIGSEVRESFSAVIDDILEDESLLPDFPVITRHPDLEALQLMQFASPQPVWGQAICTHARNMVDEGITLHWFTDGSCLHPTCRHTRHSAFAVVLDLCKTDDERRAISEQYRGSTLSIPTFQVVCTARCQGEQDILRAEVSAVVSVAENVGHGVIHVDSQVAISNVQLALTSLHPAAFAGCEHVDLLLRLWKIRHGVHIQLVKIKSHQDPGLIDDPLLRYWALGNNHVDAVAQVACSSLNTALVQQLDLVRQDLKVDKKRLEAVYDLHILLQEVRRLATANKESEISTKLHDHRALCAAFSNWTVQPGVFQFQEPDLRLLGSSAFGEEFARRTVEWSRHLIWPDDASGPLGCNTGITWVELALSWMLFNQLFLPVLRKDCLGINRLCFPGGYDGAKQYGLSFLESGTMVQKLLTNTAGLVPQEIMPSGLTHGKCSALYRLGSCRFYQGLDRRPQIPFQAEVVQLLAAVVGTGRKEALSDTPNLAFPAKQDQVARGTWQFRLRTSSLAMKTARKRRKEIINL